MRVDELELDERIIRILELQGIKELYPPQIEGLKYALNSENLVLAIPTASGKTLVAYLAILKSVLTGGKAMYIVPLRALASEKYEEMKEFEKLGLRVVLSYGDLDAPEPELERFDIIIVTSEKADSLLRHKSYWLSELTVVIADEIHLIQDSGRGPTLEVILARFKQINPKAQIIALSASIQNSAEIAEWLNAKHVKSSWRPVPLKKGVLENEKIYFSDNTVTELKECAGKKDISALTADTIKDHAQILIFVNTRKSAETLAEKLSSTILEFLSEEEKKKLIELSEQVLEMQSEPTSIGARLAKCVANGCAFHHAGLANSHRNTIEKNFKNRFLKCIVATPTLAWGVNLPARRVAIRDLWRYDANFGMMPIPVLDAYQMMGRAGRPQYDAYGEAVLVAKNEFERLKITEEYLLSESEEIISKLGNEHALRTHILASIASGFADDYEDLRLFLNNTFFAHQKNIMDIDGIIENVIRFLAENELVNERDEKLIATPFGKRVSELYIDPLSAVILHDALINKSHIKPTAFSFLHAICSTPDMQQLYIRQRDDWVEEELVKHDNEFLIKDEDYDWFLTQIKTAALLEDWVSEHTEEYISKKYDIGPGDIYTKIETGEWLLYSTHELAKLFNRGFIPALSKLAVRIKYGVKEELVELVQLKGIGRVRARALFTSGFKTLRDLRKANLEEIAKVKKIGSAVAKSIKAQLE